MDSLRSLTALGELELHVLGDVHPEVEHVGRQEVAQVCNDEPAVVMVETGDLHLGPLHDVHDVLEAGVLQHVLGTCCQAGLIDAVTQYIHLERRRPVVSEVPSELVRHALADRDADLLQDLVELEFGLVTEVAHATQVDRSHLCQLVDVLVPAVLQAVLEALAEPQAVDAPLERRVPSLLEGCGRLIFGCGRSCSEEELPQGALGVRVAGDVVELYVAADDIVRVLEHGADRGVVEIGILERLRVTVLEDEGQALDDEHEPFLW